MTQDLTVLLGASGGLGHRIALRLGAVRRRLVLVGRTRARLQDLADQLPCAAAVCALDVAAADALELVSCIEAWADPPQRLTIIDTVLDKASTRAMRRSLLGAVRVVDGLVTWGDRRGHELIVVSANSIAAHARWPASTTYGRLKRCQARAYSAMPVRSSVVYLPYLHDGGSPGASTLDQLLWPYFDFPVRACSFDLAADLLSAVASSEPLTGDDRALEVQLVTRDYRLIELRGLTPGRPPRIVAALAAAPIALLGKSLCRSSPAWQRRPAYACRFLTPGKFRDARDHHRLLPDERATIVDVRGAQ